MAGKRRNHQQDSSSKKVATSPLGEETRTNNESKTPVKKKYKTWISKHHRK
jgi:hypothetical protein